MADTIQPEHWLRGAVPGITPFLQPVAHALLQANDEVTSLMNDFPQDLLWKRPAGMASPGFHLQHLAGVLDRLFTYADGKKLNEAQLSALKGEGSPVAGFETVEALVEAFNQKIQLSIEKLKNRNEHSLTEERFVGRAQLPSTVLGLLFHAAEHTMRHTGQLLVTVNVLKTTKKVHST